MPHRSPYVALLFATGALSLLGSCKEACDAESLPQYTFTAGERAWADPFAPGTIWRFRNAAGYVRTYRIDSRNIEMSGSGNGKSSLCPKFYEETASARLSRTDSASTHNYYLYLRATSPSVSANNAELIWGNSHFAPPITQTEASGTSLATFTFEGRTYTQVLGPLQTGLAERPTSPLRLYLSKTEGVIRFEEKNGAVWNRL